MEPIVTALSSGEANTRRQAAAAIQQLAYKNTKAQLARVRRARLVSHGLTTFASSLGRWETLGSLY